MRSFRIGSAFGIPIELDLTFLLVLPLFAYLIGSEVGTWVGILDRFFAVEIAPEALAGNIIPFVVGTIAAVGLFVSVLLHELGHSLVARRYGYPITSITLWLFGGIAQFDEMPEEWKQELFIAIAGPLVSVGLGLGLFGGFWVLPSILPIETTGPAALVFILGYLAVTNIALAAFNMLPGFPMDGGRVLRSLLSIHRPYARATEIAAEVGKLFAIALGLIGLFVGFNLLLVGVAFFIYIGATSEAQQAMMKATFKDVVVRDIMTPAEDVSTIDTKASVSDLLERMFRERHTGYPVLRDGTLVGLVTLEDAQNVTTIEQDAYLVEEIMSTDIISVGPEENAMQAFTMMQEKGIGRLLVMDSEEIVGLITRSDMMTARSIIRSSGALESQTNLPSDHSTGQPSETR
jgi:Zn-dependent protease/CBS domain-containing protein